MIGLGNFGSAVADALARKGHDVIAVDLDQDAVDRISNRVARAVVADGTDGGVISGVHARAVEKIGVSSTVFPERDSGIRLAESLASAAILNYAPPSPGFSDREQAGDLQTLTDQDSSRHARRPHTFHHMTTLPAEESSILRAILDALDVGIVIADDSATYRDANQVACDLYGRSRDALLGAHVSEFIEDARRRDVDVQWRAFLRDGSQNGVFRILRSDGTSRELAFDATANVLPGLHVSFLTPAAPESEPSDDGSSRITLCAWTKRVLFGERWVTVEEYLKKAHGVTVSHGLSPSGFKQFSPGERRPST